VEEGLKAGISLDQGHIVFSRPVCSWERWSWKQCNQVRLGKRWFFLPESMLADSSQAGKGCWPLLCLSGAATFLAVLRKSEHMHPGLRGRHMGVSKHRTCARPPSCPRNGTLVSPQ